jgi:hypothetical protein
MEQLSLFWTENQEVEIGFGPSWEQFAPEQQHQIIQLLAALLIRYGRQTACPEGRDRE